MRTLGTLMIAFSVLWGVSIPVFFGISMVHEAIV